MTDEGKATLEMRFDDLRKSAVTQEQWTELLAQVRELKASVGQLERRINAIENRPAVGTG
jgi:hypothetical protein